MLALDLEGSCGFNHLFFLTYFLNKKFLYAPSDNKIYNLMVSFGDPWGLRAPHNIAKLPHRIC